MLWIPTSALYRVCSVHIINLPTVYIYIYICQLCTYLFTRYVHIYLPVMYISNCPLHTYLFAHHIHIYLPSMYIPIFALCAHLFARYEHIYFPAIYMYICSLCTYSPALLACSINNHFGIPGFYTRK